MYLYDGSFDIQMLNYCHPNCLSHFKPVKFDLCVQIVQIQIATAYLLFSFFRNFILLYCNLFELDNLRVPGTIWQNNFLLIFWRKRVESFIQIRWLRIHIILFFFILERYFFSFLILNLVVCLKCAIFLIATLVALRKWPVRTPIGI